MLFNSYSFLLLFLPFILTLIFLLKYINYHSLTIWITGIGSLVFYSVEGYRSCGILLLSILINFYLGQQIDFISNQSKRKIILFTALIINFGGLFFYKYFNFFLKNLNTIFNFSFSTNKIVMPLGISFFTFTQISYIIDVYKRKNLSKSNFRDYFSFVTFFPHLVAGPILRHHLIIPQLQKSSFGSPRAQVIYLGLCYFICGLFKKVIIADSLSGTVSLLFDNNTGDLITSEAWLAGILYTLQIYFDFSGYSEMAVGLAYFLNVKIPINFLSPYQATSIIDFWRRWHISLSLFLRDYLYIPLGGSQRGKFRHLVNLLATFVLSGLWHGAGWTFIIWGAWHGTLVIINHAWKMINLKFPFYVGWLFTFISVIIGWVWFRAHDVTHGWKIISSMFGLNANVPTASPKLSNEQFILNSFLACLTVLFVAFIPNIRYFIVRKKASYIFIFFMIIMAIISFLNISNPTEFIYFIF